MKLTILFIPMFVFGNEKGKVTHITKHTVVRITHLDIYKVPYKTLSMKEKTKHTLIFLNTHNNRLSAL